MKEEPKITCDVCGKPIDTEHQKYFMVVVKITHTEMTDGCGGTEDVTTVYHVHNDLTNHCMRKLWDILEKHRKD